MPKCFLCYLLKFKRNKTIVDFKGHMWFKATLVVCLVLMRIRDISNIEDHKRLGINSDICGTRPFSTRSKIVGGRESKEGDWGWQV